MSIISDLFLILDAMGGCERFLRVLHCEEGGGAGLGNIRVCVLYLLAAFFWDSFLLLVRILTPSKWLKIRRLDVVLLNNKSLG